MTLAAARPVAHLIAVPQFRRLPDGSPSPALRFTQKTSPKNLPPENRGGILPARGDYTIGRERQTGVCTTQNIQLSGKEPTWIDVILSPRVSRVWPLSRRRRTSHSCRVPHSL